MNLYHIWCDLKDGVSDLDFVEALQGYLGALEAKQLESQSQQLALESLCTSLVWLAGIMLLVPVRAAEVALRAQQRLAMVALDSEQDAALVARLCDQLSKGVDGGSALHRIFLHSPACAGANPRSVVMVLRASSWVGENP